MDKVRNMYVSACKKIKKLVAFFSKKEFQILNGENKLDIISENDIRTALKAEGFENIRFENIRYEGNDYGYVTFESNGVTQFLTNIPGINKDQIRFEVRNDISGKRNMYAHNRFDVSRLDAFDGDVNMANMPTENVTIRN